MRYLNNNKIIYRREPINDKPTKVKLFENKIYDYDLVQSGRPGKPIGLIIEKDGKKQVKFIKK